MFVCIASAVTCDVNTVVTSGKRSPRSWNLALSHLPPSVEFLHTRKFKLAKSKPLPPPASVAALARATTKASDHFSSGDYLKFLRSVDIEANKKRAEISRIVGESREEHRARRDGAAHVLRDAPPQVTRGERVAATLILEGGKLCEVTERRGWGGDCAFVDWLNFTVNEETFSGEWSASDAITDEQIVLDCSALCEHLFGFGITKQRERGANFYHRSYVLGDGYGMVCHGGQRHTLLISLSGEGCAASKQGWEMRVFNFLKNKAIAGKITRCDVAHDVYEGDSYNVDIAKSDYCADKYCSGGRTPDCEQRGNWHSPNGKGRSFYVGHRTNGKYARVYEKGRQLGDKNSPWVRVEVEFKAVDRVIPFDVLFRAGEYLGGAYPAFEFISQSVDRIKTTQKSIETSYQSTVEWLHRQCGAALWVLSVIEGGAEQALSKVVQVGKIPARLSVPDYICNGEFIHHAEKNRERLPLAMFVGEADSLTLPAYSAAF